MKRQREGGFLLSKIHQLSHRIFNRLLRAHGIDFNSAQGRILFVLWREDDLPINALAQRTALGKSTLTSMLDRLEAAGYLQRVPDPADRRSIRIRRTDKDRVLQDQYIRVSREMTRLFYRDFEPADIDAFEGYLRRVLANLESAERPSGGSGPALYKSARSV